MIAPGHRHRDVARIVPNRSAAFVRGKTSSWNDEKRETRERSGLMTGSSVPFFAPFACFVVACFVVAQLIRGPRCE
mgnify:CR=1 FL=1